MDKDNEFVIHVKKAYERYYKAESSYGIYGVTVEDNSPNQDMLDGLEDLTREINLVGCMPKLEDGSLYIAKVKEKNHPQYGKQYEAVTVYKKPFSTREEQLVFLGTLITPKQLDSICEVYPNDNLIDLLEGDKLDVALISGIGDRTYEKIKAKIAENKKYELAIVDLNGKFGINFNAIKRLSEKYGSPDILIQKINENPYILTEVDGYGFKKVDDLALQMGVDKKSENRITSCIEYILNSKANDGHAWIKKTTLISGAIKLLNLRISDIEEVLDLDKKRKFIVEDNIVFLIKYFEYEIGLAKNILRLLESENHYVIESLDEAIKEVEVEQGFNFTEEQRKAITNAISYNVMIVNGKAGTGKTAVIKGIVQVLKKVKGLEYATCALSGKASQRIQESTGLDSFTMHRLLGYKPGVGFAYDDVNQLGQDIIILDEASMVNTELFFYLTRAIKSGAKLIITGDTAQLEPIGVGNALVDLLSSDIIPKVELTIVHRQAQKSGILSSANLVREGEQFLSKNNYKNQRIGELRDLYLYPYEDGDKVFDTVIKIAKKYDGDIMDFQVLVPLKNRGKICTAVLNEEMQLIFNQDPTFVDKRRKVERTIENKKVTFLEGDKIIIQGNHPDKGVFNGTMGIIEYIDSLVKDGEVIIDFEGTGRVKFTKDEMKSINLGYAITIHKSQGSQWKFVVMALDYASYVMLNRQSTYTGMTRAELALFLVVELKALFYSIETDNSSKRNTFLPKLIPVLNSKSYLQVPNKVV